MIIKKTRLNPFGGIKDIEIMFTGRLNIILGPNEAGKTTVFYAIQNVLFTPANLNPSKFKDQMGRFIPIGGGDAIHVEIELLHHNDPYLLKRTWGVKTEAKLILPDGAVIHDEKKISERLESLLYAKEGTYKSVLMTYQTGLSKTIEELKKDYKETVHTLGDILRRSILETDGVSIDRFRENIQKIYDEYFDHWDEKLSCPEKGRGINNPYKKKVGQILQAFYHKERTKDSYQKALEYDKKMDQINQQISEKREVLQDNERFINENKSLYEAAKERKIMELKVVTVKSNINELKEANNRWPVAVKCISDMDKNLTDLEEQEKKLSIERDEAKRAIENSALREKYNRLVERMNALDKEKENLKKIKRVDRDELASIQKLYNTTENLKTRLSAGKFLVSLQAKKDLLFFIQRDLESVKEHKIKKNQILKLESGGRMLLKNPDLEMEITSGKNSAHESLKSFEESKGQLKKLYAEYEISSPEEATELNRIYEECLQKVNNAQTNFENDLGEYSFDELKEKVEKMGAERETRPVEEIITEISKIQNEINNVKKDRGGYQAEIIKYKTKYDNQEKLLLRVADIVKEHDDLTKNLEKLPQLPEDFNTPDDFIKKYDEAKDQLNKMKDEAQELLLERANLEKEEPEISSEEYYKGLADSEERFNSVLQRGKAISRIRDLSHRIMKELDSSTYKGIEKKLENYIAIITNKRYEHIQMEESLPQGFMRDDGKTVPYELLSTGTRDVLALALRLSMAEYFLEETDGFLIMDDPLVNLDPDRQKKAAEVIREFSTKKQLLLFTCQPSHAEILGDTVINV